jgi:hypothetical protein
VAITRAPAATPTWIAAEPTPPAPACTSSHSPGCSAARRCSPTYAVWYVSSSPAASSAGIPSGISKQPASGSTVSSASPPAGSTGPPMTRAPVSTTVPQTSSPGVNGSGGRSW